MTTRASGIVGCLPVKSECAITCSCGHRDEFMAFCVDSDGKDLPPNEHRCPKCLTHIRRVAVDIKSRWPRIRLDVLEERA
jgi:hypothetical protein